MTDLAFFVGSAFGAVMALLSQKMWQKWAERFGPPTQAPRSPAQQANQDYYADLQASRGEWRSTRLRRRVQRNARRRNTGEDPTLY